MEDASARRTARGDDVWGKHDPGPRCGTSWRRTGRAAAGLLRAAAIAWTLLIPAPAAQSQSIDGPVGTLFCDANRSSGPSRFVTYGLATERVGTCKLHCVRFYQLTTEQQGDGWRRWECVQGSCYESTSVPNLVKCASRLYEHGKLAWAGYGRLFWLERWIDCPAGSAVEPETGACVSPPPPGCAPGKTRKNGQCVVPPTRCGVGNPCDPATGNKYQREPDYEAANGVALVRAYNSGESADVGFGPGWTSTLHKQLIVEGEGLIIRRGDGRGDPWKRQDGAWSADPDSRYGLSEDAGGFTVTLASGGRERYDLAGRIRSETGPAGGETVYTYDTSGRLAGVAGPDGHAVTLGYDAHDRVATFTDPGGGVYRYRYDPAGNLTGVTYPDGAARTYHYEDPDHPHALTGITDENGARFATFSYDGQGRARSTEHAATSNGAPQERFQFDYSDDTLTAVTDPAGQVWDYAYRRNLGVPNLTAKTSRADGSTAAREYDARNNLLSVTDEAGRTTRYTYNDHNQRTSVTRAAGTAEQRTTTFEYLSPDIDLPTRVVTPSVKDGLEREELTTYDAALNVSSVTVRGFRPDGTPVARTTAFRYDPSGRITEIDGPRTDADDVTTLTYHQCGSGGGCGRLAAVTDAAGHTATFDAYDAHGRLIRSTDALGTLTTRDYDARGRLVRVTRAPLEGPSRTTTLTYDAVGQLVAARGPDGMVLSYSYDAAHDLRSISDNAGNRIEYDYDLKGNRIRSQTRDPDGALVRTVETVYDLRDRVLAVDAAGSVTGMLRDAVGNLLSETDPKLNPAAKHSYDALGRLIETVDALAGPTRYTYDGGGNVAGFTAPNGAGTAYHYDDLGNLLQEVSPDRGATNYAYDSAGNMISAVDARGVAARYTYDALNRPTGIDYAGDAEDVLLVYDSHAPEGSERCAHGVGRLCRVVDAGGETIYAYDPWGNVVREQRTELGHRFTTLYTYDAGDRVVSMTYPSGRGVDYGRDAVGRITELRSTLGGTAQTAVYGRTYRADGRVAGQTLGNGLAEHRRYDLQGRLKSQTLGAHGERTYEYDPNGNVTAVSSPARRYAYDALDRLIAERSEGQAGAGDALAAWRYDADGNRLQWVTGTHAAGCGPDNGNPCGACTPDGWCFGQRAETRTYAYQAQSNRIVQNGGKDVVTDAAGNIVSDGRVHRGYAYDLAGRLSRVYKGGRLKGAYTYNAWGQRTRKVEHKGGDPNGRSARIHFYHYDLGGNLIGEYRDGEPLHDYLWADAVPVQRDRLKAMNDGTVRVVESLFITVDHLNTPRLATDQDNTIVWRWDADAFGNGGPNEDPDGDGTDHRLDLRFPGQYADSESGLFYNIHRYYDPGINRYLTVDPIGLKGGSNTYLYARANPLGFVDPLGLAVQGSWIRRPRINIQGVGIDGWDFVHPSFSAWGYLKFIRLRGHASGQVNVDVKCTDDCKDWEVHDRVSVDVQGAFDVGPNLYAIGAGFLTRPFVGLSVNIALWGAVALQAEHHYLSLAREKAGSIITGLFAQGPTLICLGTGR